MKLTDLTLGRDLIIKVRLKNVSDPEMAYNEFKVNVMRDVQPHLSIIEDLEILEDVILIDSNKANVNFNVDCTSFVKTNIESEIDKCRDYYGINNIIVDQGKAYIEGVLAEVFESNKETLEEDCVDCESMLDSMEEVLEVNIKESHENNTHEDKAIKIRKTIKL